MSQHVTSITSGANSQYKIWKSLTTSKGLKEHQQLILSGHKLVQEFLNSPIDGFKIETALVIEPQKDFQSIRQTLLSKDLFAELDILGTHSPLLVLSFKPFVEFNDTINPKGLELVCPLGDPRNLGALTRTALSFGVSMVALTQESTHPYLPQAIKASSGAVLRMKFSKSSKPMNKLSVVGENYALSLSGQSILKTSWPQDLRLWVGEEGPGLNLTSEQGKSLKMINIPTAQVESLNAMVSAGLAIWEWRKQQ